MQWVLGKSPTSMEPPDKGAIPAPHAFWDVCSLSSGRRDVLWVWPAPPPRHPSTRYQKEQSPCCVQQLGLRWPGSQGPAQGAGCQVSAPNTEQREACDLRPPLPTPHPRLSRGEGKHLTGWKLEVSGPVTPSRTEAL